MSQAKFKGAIYCFDIDPQVSLRKLLSDFGYYKNDDSEYAQAVKTYETGAKIFITRPNSKLLMIEIHAKSVLDVEFIYAEVAQCFSQMGIFLHADK